MSASIITGYIIYFSYVFYLSFLHFNEFFPFSTYLHIIVGTTDKVCRVNEVSTAVIARYCGDRYIKVAVTGRVEWGIG